MATPHHAATRMTILVGDSDRWHHKSLVGEIVHRAQALGLAGATVIHGIEGYGAHRLIHTDRFLSLSEDLPAMIVIVDEDERIRTFLAELDQLIGEGLVMLDPVEVIHYTSAEPV